MASKLLVLILALALVQGSIAQSEISFEWVTVGDPGNPNDPLTGIPSNGLPTPARGAVPYVYSISKYETTIGQYTAFLNAVAKSDPHGLYNPALGNTDSIRGIVRSGTDGTYVYSVKNDSLPSGLTSANLPISYITYPNAVRFVNWLHNGQGNGSTETGAYTINEGGISATHTQDARYWIPTENEWYKAAYYDPSPQGPADHYWQYPWRSDQVNGRPANFFNGTYAVTGRSNIDASYTYVTDVRDFDGTPSYYGTLNQAGNVEEWTEGDAFSGGPHSRGGHWNGPGSNQTYDRKASFSPYPYSTNPAPGEIGFRVATVANPAAGGLKNGDKIRFYPRAGHGDRMVGGVFEGSTDQSSYTILYTITQTPPDGWTEVSVNFDKARFLRYRSPDNGQGNVAEIEFYRSGSKVIGAASGTPGSWSGKGNDTFRAALDGNTSTFFDAPQPNGDYVELDTGTGTPYLTPAGFDSLRVAHGFAAGVGFYPPAERVDVDAAPAPPGQYFTGWDGFTTILDDPTRLSTTATIPGNGVDLWLTATFKPLPPGSYNLTVGSGSGTGVYPSGTMVTVSAGPAPAGRQFAGWAGDIIILSNPFLATTTAIVPSMDVNIGATYSAAGPSDKIRFYPRRDHTDRMIGGVFEGTNGDPVSGPYSTIYTVTSNPALAWSEVNVSLADQRLSDAPQYRYLRYRGPTDSFGNVAEIEFYRNGVKLTGAGFGTPGSWSNQGSTFDKALDGNLNTFFDASINTGAYVGIDTQAFSITIPNGSFENPDFADGSGLAQPTPGIYYDWNYDQVPLGGGQFAIIDSNDSRFPNTTGNGQLPRPADGQQYAILGTGRPGQSTSITNVAPLATFQSGRTYTLSVAAGNEITSQFSLHTGSLKIALLASDAVVAENSIPYATIPLGSFKVLSTSFSAEQSLAGRPLNIRITYTAGPDAGDNGCFDNVTLSIDSGTISGDMIRFYPRRDHTDRMIGGVFEGTSGDPVNGPYTAIYTITSNPPLAWNEVSADLKNCRYLRYRGPTDSFGNVAEIEFYRNGVKLTGAGFGTPGSWNNQGSTFDKALDGNLETFFDASINTGAYVGIDAQ